MFEPEIFQKQIYCIEESACDIFGLFGDPAVIRRPGNCTPRYTPDMQYYYILMLCFFVGTIQGISHLHDFMGVTGPRKILTLVYGPFPEIIE